MDDRRERRFMDQALAEARRAARVGEVPVGAVVVHGDQVLSAAHNLREALQDPTAHAEMLAIRAAAVHTGSWRLYGCELYVTLEPCAMCTGALILARIGRCVYGAADPKGGFLGTVGDLSRHPALNHSLEVVSGVAADQSAELLRSFFRRLRHRA